MKKPIIGITMGDAAGIGPEIILKTYQKKEIFSLANIIVIGDKSIIEEAMTLVKSDIQLNIITSVKQAKFKYKVMDLIDLNILDKSKFAIGEVDKVIGEASVQYIIKATELALAGEIDAIVSAPLNKTAMHLAGYKYAGQTELLAKLTKTKEYGMILFFGSIKIFFVTNHVSLKNALRKIKKKNILQKIKLLHKALIMINETELPIAVAGLNPHAGENGKFGEEEIKEIIPAINEARNNGINVIGPFPADTIFIDAQKDIYSAVLVMYHDQGNIPVKLLKFGVGVTFISGLPIIRTSVAHGTAFDIAGQGIALPNTLINAVKLAINLVLKKKKMNL